MRGSYKPHLGGNLPLVERGEAGSAKARNGPRPNQQHFRLLERVPAIIYTQGAGPSGKCKYISPQVEMILGFTPSEWMQDPELWLRQVHPDDRDRVLAEECYCLASGEPLRSEYRMIRKDGRNIWVLDDAIAEEQSDGSAVLHGTIIDISDRKYAEEALHHCEVNLRAFFDNATFGIARLHVGADRFLSVNPALLRMLGYESSEELLSVSLSQRVFDSAKEGAEFCRQIAQAGRARGEMALKRKDGKAINVRMSGHRVTNGVSTCELLIEDLSDRRSLEAMLRQAQKMEAIGQLAGGIAHDFNNMLMIIGSHTELLMDALGDEQSSLLEQVSQIKAASKRAAGLSGKLLAFSRKQVLSPRIVPLIELVRDLGDMLTRPLGAHIELTVLPNRNCGRIKADPGEIEQVIMNLVVNARDAMPRGGKLIIETANLDFDDSYCHLHPQVSPGKYVMLAVSDTGCGMDATTCAHVFEPFFTTKPHGTGLGLATAYGIVKQNRGYIWVYSELGKGTTFKVYLPRVEDPSTIEQPATVTNSARCGTETVLLVEDEPIVRELLAGFLERLGYRVLWASNGEQALRISGDFSDPIHLLITDVVMPGMGGPELSERLLPLRPAMKVVYTSGYPQGAMTHHGMLSPDAVLLQKPFELHVLAARIREILSTEQATPRQADLKEPNAQR